MDRIINDVRVYAGTIVEGLISIIDHNRDKLSRTDIETLEDAANLISHNLKEIVRE